MHEINYQNTEDIFHIRVIHEKIIYFRSANTIRIEIINAAFDELENLVLNWDNFYMILDFRQKYKASPAARKQVGLRLKLIKSKINHAALILPNNPYFRIVCTFLSLSSRFHNYSMHTDFASAKEIISKKLLITR